MNIYLATEHERNSYNEQPQRIFIAESEQDCRNLFVENFPDNKEYKAEITLLGKAAEGVGREMYLIS
jgi:hypothetical protein